MAASSGCSRHDLTRYNKKRNRCLSLYNGDMLYISPQYTHDLLHGYKHKEFRNASNHYEDSGKLKNVTCEISVIW